MFSNTLTDYIQVTKRIPPNVCSEVLSEINEAEWSTHKWYSPGSNSHWSAPEGEPQVLDASENVMALLQPHVNQAMVEYHGSRIYLHTEKTNSLVSNFVRIRFNRYSEGNHMAVHFDHIRDIFDGQIRGIPVLSIVGNLNDDYEGGELSFFGGEHTVKLGEGDICIFPSCFMYPHEVLPITEGERTSFVSWAF